MWKHHRSSMLLLIFLAAADACMQVSPGEPGIPATPCKKCAKSLITVSQLGEGAKPMNGDSIVTTGACATRTFTCKGTAASIGLWGAGGAELGSINDDANTGTVTAAMTCNAAGTGWLYMGMVITRVECAAAVPIACQACRLDLITIRQVTGGAKPMDDDMVSNPLPAPRCAVRKFTCLGDNANIEIFTGAGMSRGQVNDGPGTATLEVKCNAAGTGWENAMLPGEPITALECTTAPVVNPCPRCAAAPFEVRTDVENGKPMESDVTVPDCQRTLTCKGSAISLFEGNRVLLGEVTDIDTSGMAGTAILMPVCNAAGTGWVHPDDPAATIITSVACYDGNLMPPCKMCADALLTQTTMGPNSKPMDADTKTNSQPDNCLVRTFTCLGAGAKIEYYSGARVLKGEQTDAATPGTATFAAKCNAAGTGWESADFPGEPITTVECIVPPAVPACKMCAQDLIMVTQLDAGAKPMTTDVTVDTGACSVRTFTCTGGLNAQIGLFTGNRMPSGTLDTVEVTCNAAGTGWVHDLLPGQPITAVECSYL